MKTIHKFRLTADDSVQELRIPEEASLIWAEYVLHEKKLFLWAELDAEESIARTADVRRFKVFSTGTGIPDNAVYVKTCYNHIETRSYHIYELVD